MRKFLKNPLLTIIYNLKWLCSMWGYVLRLVWKNTHKRAEQSIKKSWCTWLLFARRTLLEVSIVLSFLVLKSWISEAAPWRLSASLPSTCSISVSSTQLGPSAQGIHEMVASNPRKHFWSPVYTTTYLFLHPCFAFTTIHMPRWFEFSIVPPCVCM